MYELSQPDDDQYCLRICRVSRRDVGPLTCTARNRHGTQACSVTLELAGGCPWAFFPLRPLWPAALSSRPQGHTPLSGLSIEQL